MGSIDAAMVHTCQIKRDTGTTQNAAGTPITNYVSTDSVCLFENNPTDFNSVKLTEAGEFIVSSPIVFLPADTVIEQGDLIVTTQSNWAGTYEVKHVDAPEIPFSGIVDHKEACLKKVAKRG